MRIRILALALFLALAGHFARGQTTQTLSAANQCTAPIDVSRLGTLGMQMTGTWSATLQPEVAIAGNPAVNTQVTPSTSSTAQATITANGGYVAAVAGYSSFLVCVTAYVSGTVTIRFQTSSSVNAGLLGGGGVVTGLNGGILGTEGTCTATGFAPAVGLDLLCPSSLSGPLSSHGWIVSINGGAWTSLGAYPDLTDVAGVSLSSGVPFYFPVGSSGTPSISFTGDTSTGFFRKSAGVICYKTSTDTCDTLFSGGTIGIPNNTLFGWAASGTDATTLDTGFSRGAAATVDCGNGVNLDTSCKLKLAAVISVGTKFTTNAGCGESAGTTTGGASAGKFTTSGSTSCTSIVTLGNTATAPNGWACYAHDLTTSADYNNPRASSSGTTVTIVTGTIVSGDVIEFGCLGY